MDRRGGMAPMMPFFPGSGLGDQPTPMPAPEMPPFPHMRERFPNSVWAPDGNQGQWGAFHPPGLAPPPMGPPAHPAHQYNQFEPRQPVFNFTGSATSQAPNPATVPQFNDGFGNQYNVNPETVTGYVPQGHFSPQTTTSSVPYSSGAPFIGHPQGNGLINATNAQPHPYPAGNEYAQAAHHSQQGVFKSPMPSPAVPATEQTAFTVSSMPSPHTTNNHNEQTIIPCQQVTAYSNHPSAECAASLSQSSPHANAIPCTSMGNNNATNVNSSVQSRLKTMIMSRQGTTGSHGSAFSEGLSDSPPPGELRFSGSVSAVTSVESSPDQVQESIKMAAQNFLAYRTAEPGPGSVVQHSSDEKGDFTVNQKTHVGVVPESVKSDCDNIATNLNRLHYNSSLQPNEAANSNLNKDDTNCVANTKVDKCQPTKSDNTFKQPEEALEELFNGTKMDTYLTESNQTHSLNRGQIFARDTNFINSPANALKNNEMLSNEITNCDQAFLKPGATNKGPSVTKPDCEYLNRCSSANAILDQNESQSYDRCFQVDNQQKQALMREPSVNVARKEKGKSLSVYDFPDSPDQQPTAHKGCAGFRLGRVRGGAGLPITTTTTHCRPVCASAPLCGVTTIPTSSTQVGEDGGSELAKVDTLLENTLPPSLLHPQPFVSHMSSASASPSLINPQYASFLPTTTVNSSCSTIPSLMGKDGHSSLHNKEQNCMSPSFHKQNTGPMPLSVKMSPVNQRELLENFSGTDESNIPTAKSCHNYNQISTQTSESMSNISKINPNMSISQHPSTYNAFYAQQRNEIFNNQRHLPFGQLSSSGSFFPCNNMSVQPQSNLAFNMQSQNSFNPKTGMPHSLSVGTYGHSNQSIPSAQNSFFYQPGKDSKVQSLTDVAKLNQILPLQNMQSSTPSSLDSLQRLSKNNDESKCKVTNVSPQESPKSAPNASPITHSVPVSNAAQPLTPHINQNITRISPQRSSPQDISQTSLHSAPSHIPPPFGMMQVISNAMPQQIQNSLQSLPITSPINMPHRSPQNIPHPSPHNMTTHLSPHPSPQSMPLSSPQNMPIHTSPNNISQSSPQGVPHLSHNMTNQQNLPHQSPQQQTSPQNFTQSVQPSLPQTSPQNISQPSPQSGAHPPSHNTLQPTEIIPQHMSLNINHTAQHLQHNLPINNSQTHQTVVGHPPNTQVPFANNAQNLNNLGSGSNFSRPTPQSGHSPAAPYAMNPTMGNPGAHGMYPSFTSNYPPYGMPYQSMNHGYQHRMYSPMHMAPVNQVFPNCQHPIKSMSNIAMPQTMMQPCLPSEPPPATKFRPKKGAPKKPRKPKETKQQKQKQQKEEIEKSRILEINQQQFHPSGGKEVLLGQQNSMMLPNSQMYPMPAVQTPICDGISQASINKQGTLYKREIFHSPQIPVQNPQSWHPASGLVSINKPNSFYQDHKGAVLQEGCSVGGRCFPSREEYIPLNMLNQQQSEMFKTVSEDTKACSGPGLVSQAKFNLHIKNEMYDSSTNNIITTVPGLPSQPPSSGVAAIQHTIETNQGTPIGSHASTTQVQAPYPEQAEPEVPIKQENKIEMLVMDQQTNQNNSICQNTEPVCVKLEMNPAMTDKQHPTQLLSSYVKEEPQSQNQLQHSDSSIATQTLYQENPTLISPTVETTPITLTSQTQSAPLETDEKTSQTEVILPIDDTMEMEQIKNRMKANELLVPKCSCLIPSGTPDSGPVYTHLGAGPSLLAVREKIKKQTGFNDAEIRIEKVLFSGKDGKTESGCPLPKWIIRRSGTEEKVLVVVKQRLYHSCESAWIVIVVVAWEGFPSSVADDLYAVLVNKLNTFGNPTERRCGTNEDRTCACQGDNAGTCGASYSFGCSWSMYYNMCKFARSKNTRKFKLTDEKEEKEIEEKLQCIATSLAPIYQQMAPVAYQHQVALEEESLECRLGKEPGRPWTGVTACLDFCSHAHKDSHNIHNGCTVVATLTKGHGSPTPTKNVREQTPPDEQLHVLPLYILDTNDENGNSETLDQKVKSGAVEVLSKYPFPMRLRSEPLLSCRARNLLARGLPLPNSIRGKAKAKAKLVSLANIRRKSPDENIPMRKKPKSEVSDKLGLDVDFLLASGDLEDNYDEFSKYSIDSDDYSWILDLGNDDENNKNTLSSESKDDKKEMQPESKILPGYSGKLQSLGVIGTMPPPQSPAPRRTNSPSIIGNQQHCTTSPVVSPSMALTLQSPVESPPPVLTPVPNLSPFSPQMPHLSPHGSHSSPDSPRKTPQNSEVNNAPSSTPEIVNSLAVSHASIFTASHNSPEMPRLSPHVAVGTFSPIGPLSRPVDKLCPISNIKQITIQQPLNQSQLEIKSDENKSDERDVNDGKSQEDVEFTSNLFENKDGSPHIFTRHSDNYQSFEDANVGGVGIAVTHGSVLFEYARQELHSTTALRSPNRKDPKRISLVFYHHKNLIYRNHGMKEFEEKMEKKRSAAEKDDKEGKPPPVKKRKCTKKVKDEKVEPLNGIKRMKFDIEESNLENKKGQHPLSNKCPTVFNPSHMHLQHHPDIISPPISYANYPHTLPSFADGGRPYSPSSGRNCNTPAFTLASKSPHINSQSPSLETYPQKVVPTQDHNYGTPAAPNHGNILPPFNTNLQDFNPYNGRGPSPYASHFQPYMEMSGNNFSSYQPSGYLPKGHASPINYNNTTYVPPPYFGLTPPYSPGTQPHGQTVGPVQSQMPFAPTLANPFDDSMRSGSGTMTTPTTWSQMRHAPSFHVHGAYSPWPGS